MLNLLHIDKTFGAGTVDEKQLFRDFNLHIKEGEFVGMIGSNGSGKTTLLNVIAGNVKADAGQILLGGQDISKKRSHKRAKRIGRVFQNPSMGTCASMTIWENLSVADHKGKTFGLSRGLNQARKSFYQEQLELLGLGLENRMNTNAGALSGGQRQALALIMATMVRPDLLLLDEHTAALDPKSSEIIMHLTEKIVTEKKITTLMITHNLRYAIDYGTRTIMLHEGKSILDKSGEEKNAMKIDDFLEIFNQISIECGN